MERAQRRLKYAVSWMYAAIVLVELLAVVALIALFLTGDLSFFVLGIVNVIGAAVLNEMLKAQCRAQDDWYDAYVAAMDKTPQAGWLFHVVRAIIHRRRLQRS